MSKGMYFGVDSKARKVKNLYFGVNGVARKIKKAYIGIGGVARPCFNGDGIVYYGTITGLSSGRYSLAATTVGNYALFGGGKDNYSEEEYYATVDAYNSSLTRSTPSALATERSGLAATTVGNYALFGGGYFCYWDGEKRYYSTVDAYDQSLTRKSATALSNARTSLAATTVGNYALFGGGVELVEAEDEDDYYYNTVDVYNTSLTKSTAAQLGAGRYNLAATTVGNYAIFGGGNALFENTTDAYDQSLTHTVLTKQANSRAATTVGNYAIFSGSSSLVAYDQSLTGTSISFGTATTSSMDAAATIGDYALFGGGYNTCEIISYDKSLTRSSIIILTGPFSEREALAAATIGDYALFGGGCGYNGNSGEYYTVNDVLAFKCNKGD